MGCDWIELPGGGFAHINYGRGRGAPRRCQFCFQRYSSKQCDYATGPGKKTCDKYMCNQCSKVVDAKTDYCPEHAAYTPQASLFETEPTR